MNAICMYVYIHYHSFEYEKIKGLERTKFWNRGVLDRISKVYEQYMLKVFICSSYS
jgi:hypothetical protein